MRISQRASDEMRKVTLERGVVRYAEGSCLVKFGDTHVLCAASLEDKPPPWLRGQGRGWVTAEYAMLPRATLTRTRREFLDRQGVRPHPGDPAADRPFLARGRRPRPARRAPDHHRLRRAAGRRRHAHGLDHRRLGRPARLRKMDGAALDPEGEPDPGFRRRGVLRHREGRGADRSRLWRGLRRRRPTPISS